MKGGDEKTDGIQFFDSDMVKMTGSCAFRKKAYVLLEPSAWKEKGLSPVNKVICVLILFSVAICLIETEPVVIKGREFLFPILEYSLTAIFFLEYCMRLWVAVEKTEYRDPVRGRVKYAFSFYAVIDLIAILAIILTAFGTTPMLLRFFRLIRILRLARLGRFSKAISRMHYALSTRMPDLFLSIFVAGFILIISSTLLYLAEGGVQPDTFGSIPRAMWWGIATLTTVGYGDAYPITVFGKILGAITAVIGIGLIAMPAGILAAAFSDAMQQERNKESAEED